MRRILTKLFFTIIIINYISIINLVGQEKLKPRIGRGSLESQFNYVIYESEKIENFRMVKSWWLYSLKNQLKDSLFVLHDSIHYTQTLLNNSNLNIDSLQLELQSVNKKLDVVTTEKDNINILGITLRKNVYNSIMWTIIGFLLLWLLIFVVMFKRSNTLTMRYKKDLQEIKDEFEEFRKKTLLREQQTVRKLYDEVLKYKNQVKQ